jgi:hypothetical protein
MRRRRWFALICHKSTSISCSVRWSLWLPRARRPCSVPARFLPRIQVPDHLLAAFNGGFKTVHGNFGVYYQGITLVPLLNNIATLAIYKNGSVKIGAWDRDLTMTPDMLVARQNCPLLVDSGQINPSVNDESRKEWGYTVKNLDTTWRSGIGISQDGRFLFYAAGPSLTVESLARSLQMAGAYYAMQLDINGYYTRFAIYAPATAGGRHAVTATKLLNQMTIPSNQFLDAYDRDLFYLTTHTG